LVLIELWCFGDYKFVIRDIKEFKKTEKNLLNRKKKFEMKIRDAKQEEIMEGL